MQLHDDLPDGFETVRKLLRVKQHEIPPPGFYRDFPSRVIARIDAEGLHPGRSWWQRFVDDLALRPATAAAYGFCMASLLFLGARMVESSPSPWEGIASVDYYRWSAAVPAETVAAGPRLQPATFEFVAGEANASSVAPLWNRPTSRFHTTMGLENLHRASYSVPYR